MKRLLLDTDACIEIIRGNPAPLDQHPDVTIFLSTISRFEILSGLRKSRGGKREQRARAFLDAVETLIFDEAAADRSAAVRLYLEGKGTPIGAYDLLLAGHALALDCPILTGNVREFSRVPKLEIATWR
ncbi:MAG: type II toxin-antitoxin system VapC family toxin [Puniceicoccaceae bacterium]|nr:MAG: type II toxin-antitoxin system VapC family toxin [Puniceicoccaceae bacterium]